MKKLVPIIISIAMILALAACGGLLSEEGNGDQSDKPVVTDEPVVYTNPLTGEVMEEPYDNSRPFAIMISNIQQALPHCGASEADILYEVLAEGNITRMLGVFDDVSDLDKIGSMRSARPYYIELALSYDAIYVHAGGSDQAYSDIKTKDVSSIDGVRTTFKADVFYRDPTRSSYAYEHRLMTSGEGIMAGVEEKGYETMHDGEKDYGLRFVEQGEEPDMTGAQTAATVGVSFEGIKDSTLTYDGSTGLYTFSEYNKDITDGNNSQHLCFKNVLVLYADTEILDDYGRRAVDLEGSGTGLYICNGQSIDIKWKHSGTGKCFTYTTADGKELNMGIGKSYIAICPTGSNTTLA